jgi:hypothetical protein
MHTCTASKCISGYDSIPMAEQERLNGGMSEVRIGRHKADASRLVDALIPVQNSYLLRQMPQAFPDPEITRISAHYLPAPGST